MAESVRPVLRGLYAITPEGLGDAYEGLLKKKEEYLGVVMNWGARA